MQFGEVIIEGQFDHTIQTPPAQIVPSDQPPNIERLTQMSGKSPNAVKVEYDQKVRDMEDKQVKEAKINFNSNKTDKEQIEIAAFDELADEYKNGEQPSDEDDEVTYDDLTSEVATDMGQDPAAGDFNLFPPEEQSSADQMFADIDAINANEPLTDENDVSPLSMDELGEIAEPDDDGMVDVPDVPDATDGEPNEQ
jgi:hypothetical protein